MPEKEYRRDKHA